MNEVAIRVIGGGSGVISDVGNGTWSTGASARVSSSDPVGVDTVIVGELGAEGSELGVVAGDRSGSGPKSDAMRASSARAVIEVAGSYTAIAYGREDWLDFELAACCVLGPLTSTLDVAPTS